MSAPLARNEMDVVERRNLIALQSDITRLGHLQPRREVDPQLQDLERPAAFLEVVGRKLGMFEPAPGGHPLNVSRVEPLISRWINLRTVGVGQRALRAQIAYII